jgi:cold shock CspA family protein
MRFHGRCVAWSERGFGFIRAQRHDIHGCVFVHVTDLMCDRRALRPGERVSFVWKPSPVNGRPIAGDVRLVA